MNIYFFVLGMLILNARGALTEPPENDVIVARNIGELVERQKPRGPGWRHVLADPVENCGLAHEWIDHRGLTRYSYMTSAPSRIISDVYINSEKFDGAANKGILKVALLNTARPENGIDIITEGKEIFHSAGLNLKIYPDDVRIFIREGKFKANHSVIVRSIQNGSKISFEDPRMVLRQSYGAAKSDSAGGLLRWVRGGEKLTEFYASVPGQRLSKIICSSRGPLSGAAPVTEALRILISSNLNRALGKNLALVIGNVLLRLPRWF